MQRGRALDDAHFYLVRSRAPWNGYGITVRDWEALSWTLPAIQLGDPSLARELLLRASELHGYAPGLGVHYLDGTLFEPGFSLEGLASYALATDRYIRGTGDDQIVDEPVIAETLYASWDDLAERRDQHVPLYRTEVTLSGEPASQSFTLHGNAVVAQALEIFRRTLDEETARGVEDPDAVRAALRRHFATERGGKVTFASAIDLVGQVTVEDDPYASAYWLPVYDALERHDFRLSSHGEGGGERAPSPRAAVRASHGARCERRAAVVAARTARQRSGCGARGRRRRGPVQRCRRVARGAARVVRLVLRARPWRARGRMRESLRRDCLANFDSLA